MLLALAIFVATIALVVWQPGSLGIGWSALGGAAVALLTGVVSLSDIPVVWGIVWNATATFVAIIVVSLLLDEAGSFEWAALHVAVDARETVLVLLATRAPDATVCPSEVARVLGKAADADRRAGMSAVHVAIDRLVGEGRVRLSWKEQPLASRSGPYRIGRRHD